MANGTFGGGTGALAAPYLIEDAEDLNQIRMHPNLNYKLKYSINLGIPPYNQGRGWDPIQNFSGTLDGNGKKIFNLYINRPDEDDIGLFAKITGAPAVSRRVFDLGIENAKITGRHRVGILTGEIYYDTSSQISADWINDTHARIQRCYFSGIVKGASNTGGILGRTATINTNAHNSNSSAHMISILIALDCIVNVKIKSTGTAQTFGIVAGSYDLSYFSRWASSWGTRWMTVDFYFRRVIASGSLEHKVGGHNAFPFGYHRESWSYSNPSFDNEDCIYDSEVWNKNHSPRTMGISTKDIQNPAMLPNFEEAKMSDFTPTYVFKEKEYLQLYFTSTDHLFIKSQGKYMIYDTDTKSWKVMFTSLPSRSQAVDFGMKNLDMIPRRAWDELREKGTAEIINILEKSVGTESKVKTMLLDREEGKDTEVKKIYVKTIDFSEFGDDITNINP